MARRATDPLALYNAKRDFARTAEPAGKVERGAGNSFMVQKHDATRLHWDLRLELDGVLKSWAVTKGPSLDPEDKRLAVQTEDHPLSYATFEGTIPASEYGGGTVMLWDRGHWEPVEGKSARDLEKGHLHFRLFGERMKGEWLLIRLKRRPGEKRDNWLLRKIDDDHAGGSGDLVERALTSVKTGRSMQEIARGDDPQWTREGLTPTPSSPRRRGSMNTEPNKRAPAAKGSRLRGNDGKGLRLPPFRPLQLATLVDSVPAGGQWLHEVKYDGYRCLLAIGGGAARVYTRSGLDWSDKFPELGEAAAALPVGSALIDGEIVWLDAAGKPTFSGLQDAISRGGRGVVLFAFDILALDGEDLTKLPNIQRKERLRPVIPADGGMIQFAEHVVGNGEKLFDAMCAQGFEGVVSKRADAPYAGRRAKSWLKVKCIQRQEFVIVGWTPSSAKGRGFRSLLLAMNEGGVLRYAGKVGTGFNQARLEALRDRFDGIASKDAPVAVPRAEARGARWVKPEMVAEIAFAEFTADGVVRHASFIALRDDKPAAEVVPERPAAAPETASTVRISNPTRVIFPDAGITKGDLAGYYQQISGLMLQWLANRPVSLVRCPQGRAKKCFFQKHDAGSFGEAVKHVPIREKDGHLEPYLYVDGAEGLLACVQMGTIELHGWGSRVEDVEKPDRLVIDLDPDEGLGFDAVRKAAADVKRHLSDMGLVSFPLLTGGKGVHVVVPLTPRAEWPDVKDFANRFALALGEAEPERFVATMSKAKRKGRIFVDWLRNQRGATAILPYSARARPGAPVAAPVSWEELGAMEGGGVFTVRDAETLIERASGRGLKGWGVADQLLPAV